jgi:hypothetical protein
MTFEHAPVAGNFNFMATVPLQCGRKSLSKWIKAIHDADGDPTLAVHVGDVVRHAGQSASIRGIPRTTTGRDWLVVEYRVLPGRLHIVDIEELE